MRLSVLLLTCLILAACGKSGDLYLPEEPQSSSDEKSG